MSLASPPEPPPVSAVPGMADATSYWPALLSHLALPYDNGGSDYVTVAEISEAPINGYAGSKQVTVALVPLALVEQVLRSTEATGHEVDSQGPLPNVGDEGPPHRSGFWIEGFDRDMRFEPLVNAWNGSDIDVVVPDNNLGRDHVVVEIKKLYEGCPSAVIRHWHRFAVPHAVASADQATNGNRNIGDRAQELVQAYLTLTRTLASLVERLGLVFDEAEIGGFSTREVEYRGWWTFKELKALANVVPANIALEGFLDRTVAVVKLWESLKEAPLRNILLKLGIDRKATEQIKPTKLLAAICQLATIGRRAGYRWPDDSSSFFKEWDKDLRLDCFVRLFAVNQLRQKAAHRTGDDFAASLAKDLDAFGIVEAAQAGGWGHAVDTVYDRLIADIHAIANLLGPDN